MRGVWLNVSEAAKILGVDRAEAKRLARERALIVRTIGPGFQFLSDSVYAYVESFEDEAGKQAAGAPAEVVDTAPAPLLAAIAAEEHDPAAICSTGAALRPEPGVEVTLMQLGLAKFIKAFATGTDVPCLMCDTVVSPGDLPEHLAAHRTIVDLLAGRGPRRGWTGRDSSFGK